MPVLGRLIRRVLRLGARWTSEGLTPEEYQRTQLESLLGRARSTAFGRRFGFEEALESTDPVSAFQERVPVFDYEQMREAWWYRCVGGEEDVTWPGAVPYFAQSSGTSGASSKMIPVTEAMVRAIRRAGIKQLFSLAAFHLPEEAYENEVLILGGSTQLERRGSYYVGDLSGISALELPSWFQHFYRPGEEISVQSDWQRKLEEITRNARDWDVGIVTGVPSWVQLLFERIVTHYDVETVHEIWPNLSVYVHGGVAFGPYRRTIGRYFERPITYIETYIASEGYVGFQPGPEQDMRLLLNNGLFFEFVPFDESNFDTEGRIRSDPEARTIDRVEEDVPYALLLTTCAGAWRYLLGDVVRFTDAADARFVIDGRTSHFLSLAGEHLSVENMARAVEMLQDEFNLPIPEFTVAGVRRDGLFAHRWFLGTLGGEGAGESERIARRLDENLQALNDDYRIKRSGPIRSADLRILAADRFYAWMERQGRLGGQNKFPRVLSGERLADWLAFLDGREIDTSSGA